jgi:hypothetical protein
MSEAEGASGAGESNAAAESNGQAGEGQAQAQGTASQGPGAEGEGQAAQSSEKKKFKVKVFGEELERELDLKNEDELKGMLQKAMAFEKRSGDLSKKEKEIQAFMDQVKQADLVQLAKLKGLNESQLEEMAAQLLLKRIEQEQMSPEQRELHQLKMEKAQREQMEMSSKKDILQELSKYMELPANAAQYPKEQLIQALESKKAEYTQAEESLDKEIAQAWGESGLPKTKTFVTQIAQELYGSSMRKQDLTPKEAAAIVKDNWHRDVKETLDQMDAQAIHELLGEAVLKKIRKYDVDRISNRTSGSVTQKGPAHKPASQTKNKQLTEQEWAEHMDRLRANLA